MRTGNCHVGWPGCFLVRWAALLENVAQTGTNCGENFPAFLRVGVVRYLGVIFTPSAAPHASLPPLSSLSASPMSLLVWLPCPVWLCCSSPFPGVDIVGGGGPPPSLPPLPPMTITITIYPFD